MKTKSVKHEYDKNGFIVIQSWMRTNDIKKINVRNIARQNMAKARIAKAGKNGKAISAEDVAVAYNL